jgi:hypothetical protein
MSIGAVDNYSFQRSVGRVTPLAGPASRRGASAAERCVGLSNNIEVLP